MSNKRGDKSTVCDENLSVKKQKIDDKQRRTRRVLEPIDNQQQRIGISNSSRSCGVVVEEKVENQKFDNVTGYGPKMFDIFQNLENLYCPILYLFRHPHLTENTRSYFINWMANVTLRMKLKQETLYLGVSIMDRYLSLGGPIHHGAELLLAAGAALMLAIKYEEKGGHNCDFEDMMTFMCGAPISKRMIVVREWDIVCVIGWQLTVPNSLTFLGYFLRESKVSRDDVKLAACICARSLLMYSVLSFTPSMVAATSLLMARELLEGREGRDGIVWPSQLQRLTSHSLSALQHCRREIVRHLLREKALRLHDLQEQQQAAATSLPVPQSQSSLPSSQSTESRSHTLGGRNGGEKVTASLPPLSSSMSAPPSDDSALVVSRGCVNSEFHGSQPEHLLTQPGAHLASSADSADPARSTIGSMGNSSRHCCGVSGSGGSSGTDRDMVSAPSSEINTLHLLSLSQAHSQPQSQYGGTEVRSTRNMGLITEGAVELPGSEDPIATVVSEKLAAPAADGGEGVRPEATAGAGTVSVSTTTDPVSSSTTSGQTSHTSQASHSQSTSSSNCDSTSHAAASGRGLGRGGRKLSVHSERVLNGVRDLMGPAVYDFLLRGCSTLNLEAITATSASACSAAHSQPQPLR